MRRGNFNKLVRWSTIVAELGVPRLHFHDLRHTGNTRAADAGMTTAKADRLIADVLDAQLQAEHGDDEEGDDGPAGVAVPAG